MDSGKTKVKKDCCIMCMEAKAAPAYEPEMHKFRNKRGDAAITSYNVFPGIDPAFYSVHMDSFLFGAGEKGEVMGSRSALIRAPRRKAVKSVVLEHFSVSVERKSGKIYAIITRSLGRGDIFQP